MRAHYLKRSRVLCFKNVKLVFQCSDGSFFLCFLLSKKKTNDVDEDEELMTINMDNNSRDDEEIRARNHTLRRYNLEYH